MSHKCTLAIMALKLGVTENHMKREQFKRGNYSGDK